MKNLLDYSSIFYHNKLPSWIYDLSNFQILEVNQSALDHYGYSKEEFLLLTLKDPSPKDKISTLQDVYIDIDRAEGNIYFGISTHQKKNGERIRMEVNGQKLKFDDRNCVLVTCQDVTQNETQLSLLKEKNKQLEAISSIGKIGYWRIELDGNTLSWTDEVFKIWGRNREDFEVNFQNFEKTIHPEDLEAFTAAQDAAYAGTKTLDFEYRIILPDQSFKWVRENGRLLKNKEGKPYAFEGTVQDITKKKEAEFRLLEMTEKFKESEKRFRVVQEMSPDGFTILKPVRNKEGSIIDFKYIYENKAIAQINGTEPNEVIGMRLLEMFPNHQDTDIFKAYIDVANNGNTRIIEEVYVGEIISISTWLRLVIVSIGDNIAILAENISERKMTEEALQKSEGKFRSMIEIASLGIAQVDPLNGRFILVNSFYEYITGYNADELYNMSFVELNHPEDRVRDWEIFSKAAQGEEEYRNEKRYVKKDGTIIWVRIHLAFIKDKKGKATSTVAICEDITERKEAELRIIDLSNNLPGVVYQYLLFPDGTDALRSVSNGAHHLWGYSPEEVEQDINLVWDQTKVAGDFERVKQSVIEAAKTKTKWLSRYKSVLPNGNVRIFLGSGSPNFLADGTVLFNSFVLDITKEAKNEELLSDATQMARIGSWEVNYVNNKILWSDITHQLHETNPTSFIPDFENSIDFYREDFQDMIRSHFQACIEEGKPFDFEAVLVTAKNNERWVRAIGRAEMINGQCKRIHGSFQDINAYKEAYEKLKNIAWTQSHVVRAPLSRILGIINLIETQRDRMEDLMFWLDQLKISSEELDVIVRKITEEAEYIHLNKDYE